MSDVEMEEENEGSTTAAFSCRHTSARAITDVLTCLCVNMKKEHPCHIHATPEGLTFLVTGRSKSTQASAVLKAELFDQYICDADTKLALNLNLLLDCLGISSTDETNATMTYSSDDAIFRLTLDQKGFIISCDLNALCSEDFDEKDGGLFDEFRDSADEVAVLVQSVPLKDAVAELMEVPGAGSVRFAVEKHGMRLTTNGDNGCEIDFPKESNVFIMYRCDRAVKWTFPLASLQLGMKALGVAKETYIRINVEGIMSIQHQIETNDQKETFVNHLMVAEETLDDLADEDADDAQGAEGR